VKIGSSLKRRPFLGYVVVLFFAVTNIIREHTAEGFGIRDGGTKSARRGIARQPQLPQQPGRGFSDITSSSAIPTTTRLFVSELHVPGYAETKLPFIWTGDDDYVAGSGTAIAPPQILERQYTPNDYVSVIPYPENSNNYLIHKTTVPVFTAEECRQIVGEAEAVASQIEWTKNRHGNFPTTDLPIVELPRTLQFLKVALVERIYPLLRHQFGEYLPDPGKLRVADGFVVKYDAAGGQKELKPHRDGSVLSFNIALNPAADFEGGGTWFSSLEEPIKIEQGEMVSHASALLHGGHGITSGKRYIMVAFVILEGYDSWSMRFYNQVRNM